MVFCVLLKIWVSVTCEDPGLKIALKWSVPQRCLFRKPLFPARVELSGRIYCDFQERITFLPQKEASCWEKSKASGDLVLGMKQASLETLWIDLRLRVSAAGGQANI